MEVMGMSRQKSEFAAAIEVGEIQGDIEELGGYDPNPEPES